MRKKCNLLLLFTVVLLSGCFSHPSDKEIVGRYYNKSEDGVIHYLELKENYTFVHYYESMEEKHKDEGNWKLDRSTLELDGWNSYGKYDNYCGSKGCLNKLFFIQGNYLNFTPDGEDTASFLREK